MTHYSVSAILLAGGSGKRMKSKTPKQYVMLGNKPLVRHSFDLLMDSPKINEIVVVCSPEYQHLFHMSNPTKPIIFALPGDRRQDSVYNGLQACSQIHTHICVHDGARPFIDHKLLSNVIEAGIRYGAATVGMPVKFTVKTSTSDNMVENTPDRTLVWEIQTPQVIERKIFEAGFAYANAKNLTVTDDVSVVELIGKQVKLVEGSHNNIKITVPADQLLATQLLAQKTHES